MQDTKEIDAEYRALQRGAVLQNRTALGGLILRGRDRVDFLQRLTTNHVGRIESGEAIVTILTSPMARIEALFTVIAQEEELWLLPWTSTAPELARRLQAQIFFMDKVTVHRQDGEDWSRYRLMGSDAQSILQNLELPVGEDQRLVSLDGETFLLPQSNIDLPGYEIFGSGAAEFVARLSQNGVTLLEEDTAYHARRVELGRPGPGAELSEEFTPLEVGLEWACADDKGCYTGQEIIARQITYDKVTRRLVGLKGNAALEVGSELRTNGRKVGQVTTVVSSPKYGPIGLGILHRSVSVPGTVDAAGAPVSVIELPFG